MRFLMLGFLIGLSLGFATAWYYFYHNGLIRTREEWHAARSKVYGDGASWNRS